MGFCKYNLFCESFVSMFFSNSQCTAISNTSALKKIVFRKRTRYWPTNIAFVFALGLNNSQHVFCKIKVLVHVVPLFRSRVPAAYVHPSYCHSCCFRFCAVNSWSMMCRVISMEKVSFWTVPGLFHWYFINLNLANSTNQYCITSLYCQ